MNYAYGMYTSWRILFNHESQIRGEIFVTRKITHALAAARCESGDTGEILAKACG